MYSSTISTSSYPFFNVINLFAISGPHLSGQVKTKQYLLSSLRWCIPPLLQRLLSQTPVHKLVSYEEGLVWRPTKRIPVFLHAIFDQGRQTRDKPEQRQCGRFITMWIFGHPARLVDINQLILERNTPKTATRVGIMPFWNWSSLSHGTDGN